MVAVDLQVVHCVQKAFDELVSRLDGVKAVERNGVLYAGVVSIKGNDIVDTHAGELLQGDRAVQGFTRGSLGLKAFIQIGHDDRDAAGFSADCSNYTLEVGEMIIRRHVVVKSKHAVGLIVVDHVHKDVEVHAAHRLCHNSLALAGSETGLFGIDDIGGTEIACESRAVFMLVLALGAPVLKIGIDFLPHRFTSGDGDEAELAERGVVQNTFVVFFVGFHHVCSPF